MFKHMTEEQEIKLEEERAKAKAAFRTMGRVLRWLGFALALALAYGAGEMAGVTQRPEVTSDP